MVKEYVANGVNVAEIAARKYLALHGEKMSPDDKRAKALEVIMAEMKKSGITDVAEKLVVARIESWLEDSGHEPGKPSA